MKTQASFVFLTSNALKMLFFLFLIVLKPEKAELYFRLFWEGVNLEQIHELLRLSFLYL
jgi:hypothetical protein